MLPNEKNHGTSKIASRNLKKLFDEEVEMRAPRDNFFHCLVNAAHQFHNREAILGSSVEPATRS